ncbi:MAG: NAD(P)H-hydrate dehydratase [Candidatus Aenigmarchaeota archaeon]|nr:NAD(P)H-hydrate dehydratase [Candidatus Aenigmarchaeota archaeon]
MHYVSAKLLKKIYKPRAKWSHKGMYGKLLVIGGSKIYSGSPTFNAIAAYRAGCDLVTIAAPKRAADIVAKFLPDMITIPLEGDCLTDKHIKEITPLIDNHDAVVIGGGLGREKKTIEAVKNILRYIKKSGNPCVVDADALHALKGFHLAKNFALTPHSQEFFVVTGTRVRADVYSRINETKKAAAKLNCVILLKGYADVISDGKRVAVNRTGNPYMTKGGTGDTLAGICGALLARNVDAFDAACASAFINGAAGDLAAKKHIESTLASDVADEIKNVLKKFVKK